MAGSQRAQSSRRPRAARKCLGVASGNLPASGLAAPLGFAGRVRCGLSSAGAGASRALGCGVGVALSGRRPQTATWLLGRSIREVLEADPGSLGRGPGLVGGRSAVRQVVAVPRRARGAAPARPVSVSSFLGPVARRASSGSACSLPGAGPEQRGGRKAVPGRGRAAAENPSLGLAWSLTQGRGPGLPGRMRYGEAGRGLPVPPGPRASLCGEDPGPGGRRGDRICLPSPAQRSERTSPPLRYKQVCGSVARHAPGRYTVVSGTDTDLPSRHGRCLCVACPAARRCLVSPALCTQRDVLGRLGLSLSFLIGSCKAIVTIPSGVTLVWLVTAAVAVTSLGSLDFSSPSLFPPLGVWRTNFSSSGF